MRGRDAVTGTITRYFVTSSVEEHSVEAEIQPGATRGHLEST